MAIKTTELNASNGAGVQNNEGININDAAAAAALNSIGGTSNADRVGTKSIGWGTRDLMVMSSNMGSEYTAKFAHDMEQAYSKLTDTKLKINILDKEKLEGLAYSSIVVSHKSKDSVYYFIVLLAETGREAMKAKEITAELSLERTHNQRPNVFTIDDGIDEVLHTEVIRILSRVYGDVKFISADGEIARRSHSELLPAKIASTAYNADTIDPVITSGEYADLNITEAINSSPNRTLTIEPNGLKQVVFNEAEAPIRHDFSLDLVSVDNTPQSNSINLANSRDTLSKVVGFIDVIPATYIAPAMPGVPPVETISLHPHIIINSIDVKMPTPGFMFMGLVSSLIMTQENMWLPALMPKDDKDYNNIGALNIITNLNNNPNRIGEVLDLTAKNIKQEDAFGILKNMCKLTPIVSMDIESFGPQTYYTSLLSVAAQNKNTAAKRVACAEIIETVVQLTNNNFPEDFPLDKIFANTGIIVPTGIWHDKNGERDIRDVDTSFIATRNQDIDLLNKWAFSNLPKSASGVDPFGAKVEIISKLIPEAEITGKATRVTFTGEFIKMLSDAATAAGFNTRYKPQYEYSQTQNIGEVGSYLQTAGIANAAGFATQQVNSGPSYNFGYSNVGYNRF